jgi:hypothetical protein
MVMTAELRQKLRQLWREKVRYDRLFGLTEDPQYLEAKHRITEEALQLVPTLPYYDILQPYDPFLNAYFIFDFILRMLAFMPLERAHQFTRKQWLQYCGFGENWTVKPQYNRHIKEAVAIYLLNSTFPRRQPAKTVWGDMVRQEIKRLTKKGKGRSFAHCVRLAVLNVGRKLVLQLWRRAKEVIPATSFGSATLSD